MHTSSTMQIHTKSKFQNCELHHGLREHHTHIIYNQIVYIIQYVVMNLSWNYNNMFAL